jgi:hypothetical protein
MARQLPHLTWQPSDPDPEARSSIEAWRQLEGTSNLRPPLAIDATDADWGVDRAEAIVCINMVHISPWAATQGLVRGAGRILPRGGTLYLYGPYRVPGRPTAASNAAFDDSLRARNPAWGLRQTSEVEDLATEQGLVLEEVVDMPANNFSLIFRRPD